VAPAVQKAEARLPQSRVAAAWLQQTRRLKGGFSSPYELNCDIRNPEVEI